MSATALISVLLIYWYEFPFSQSLCEWILLKFLPICPYYKQNPLPGVFSSVPNSLMFLEPPPPATPICVLLPDQLQVIFSATLLKPSKTLPKPPHLFQEQKSVVDEIYWQVIRFTSVGFGDEFRDVKDQPAHIPDVINVLTVGFILLPFGISVTSFFFQMYRKLFGRQRKWIDVNYRKLQRRTLARVKEMKETNMIARDNGQLNTRSSFINIAGDTTTNTNNVISVTESDDVTAASLSW